MRLPLVCPHCGVTNVLHDSDDVTHPEPEEGDASVCYSCKLPSVFVSVEFPGFPGPHWALREFTDEELADPDVAAPLADAYKALDGALTASHAVAKLRQIRAQS